MQRDRKIEIFYWSMSECNPVFCSRKASSGGSETLLLHILYNIIRLQLIVQHWNLPTVEVCEKAGLDALRCCVNTATYERHAEIASRNEFLNLKTSSVQSSVILHRRKVLSIPCQFSGIDLSCDAQKPCQNHQYSWVLIRQIRSMC